MRSILLLITVAVSFIACDAAAGRCTGSAHCTACKTCRYCAYCTSGGTCGVCGGGSAGSSHTDSSSRSNGLWMFYLVGFFGLIYVWARAANYYSKRKKNG